MLTLVANPYVVTMFNDPTYSARSTDNVNRYCHEYDLSGGYQHSSAHGLRVMEQSIEVGSCILLASGGATGVHENSSLVHGRSCIVAVGPFLVSLELPQLQLNWTAEVDTATCFGVYHSAKHECFISHGELEISRVSYEGEIAWQKSGADILTNGFSLGDDVVEAIDWDDRRYRWDIASGSELKS